MKAPLNWTDGFGQFSVATESHGKGFRGKEAGTSTRFVVSSSSHRWKLDHKEVSPEARRKVREEVTRAWPDKGASAAGGDEPNFSLLGWLTICGNEQEPHEDGGRD